jgi:hypothetical protein
VNAVGRIWTTLRRLDPRLLDGLLTVGLSVAAGVQLLAQESGNFERLVPVTGTCLPLVLRRRYPLVAHFSQIFCAILTGREPVTVSLVAMFIGIYSVAVYSRFRVQFFIWIFVGATMLGIAFPGSSPSIPNWALLLVAGIGLWFAGSAVRDRQLRADILEGARGPTRTRARIEYPRCTSRRAPAHRT